MALQTSPTSIAQSFKNVLPDLPSEMQQCIRNCVECHEVCEQTLAYCLEKGGKHVGAAHLKSLVDCAEICEVSANFMLRKSGLHFSTCGACADICIACAESCEAMSEDQVMKACAEVCRQCAESCQMMASHRH